MRQSLYYSIRSLRPIAFLASTLLFSITPARAQTQAQITTCSGTLKEPTFQSSYTLSSTDTSYWAFDYTWDYTACATVPVAGAWLYDNDSGARYTCTYTQFTTANKMTCVCQITKVAMLATEDPDWYMFLKYGNKPTYYTREDDFVIQAAPVSSTSVTPTPTPVVSGAASRRRRNEQAGLILPNSLTCPDREMACAAGKGLWKCVNVWTDLNSCGGCPLTESSQDCGEILGASRVQCIMGICIVNSCDRNHHLSQNGTACIGNEEQRDTGFWRFGSS